MDFRNKYLVITIRTLLGLFLIFSGVSGYYAAFNGMEGVPEPMQASTQNLWDMGVFQIIKTTEIVAGLMLVFGFLPALATIFISPLAVGVIVVNARISPAFLPMGIILTVLTAYLGYVYWEKYKPLFAR